MSSLVPDLEYVVDGDQFFDKLWSMIDQSKTNIWILTYTFNNSFTAIQTMNKLIEAQRRGVQVTLLVDDLNQHINSKLKNDFVSNGGVFHSLNPTFKLWNLFNRNILHRHHEKIMVIDDYSIIGSSNITDEYSSKKYGLNQFLDINQIQKNICLDKSREYFKVIANYYNINLHPTLNNQQIVKKYNQIHPEIQNKDFNLISSNYYNYKTTQIQECVLELINKAEKNITIVQPYYYPIKKIEKAIENALERGVKLITSAKRDQPCYKYLSNILMTQKLIDKGLQVYELHSKLLHMKLYIQDDKIYTLGSFNNDRISWRINNELNILVNDEKQTLKLNKIVEDLKNQCEIADFQFRQVGLYRKSKIFFWEFVLRVGDWLGYKNYIKRFQKLGFYKSQNRHFMDWDGNFMINNN